jgi:hypothetical protein
VTARCFSVCEGGDCLGDLAVLRAHPELSGPVASDPVVSRLVAGEDFVAWFNARDGDGLPVCERDLGLGSEALAAAGLPPCQRGRDLLRLLTNEP